MFGEPKFVQGGFNIIFPRQPNIRRRAYELEDVLVGQYHQPTVLGVPDDFEPEVPRLVFTSTHGFSQILISQIAFALNVSYSSDFQGESEKRRLHLQDKVPLLFKLLDKCDIKHPCFVGLTWRVQIEGRDITDKEILQKLTAYLQGTTSNEELIDLEIKRTEIVEQRYYSNIVFANYRQWHTDTPQIDVTRRPLNNAVGRGIQLLFDYNDRYAFNEDLNYFTDQDKAFELISKAFQMTDDVVQSLTQSISQRLPK